MEDAVGGDVIIAVNDPDEKDQVFSTILETEGVSLFSPAVIYETRLVAINGNANIVNRQVRGARDRERLEDFFGTVTVRAIDGTLPEFEFSPGGGRGLGETDLGRNTIVIEDTEEHDAPERFNLKVGDLLSFHAVDREGNDVGQPVEFEVVGLTDEKLIAVNVFGLISSASDPFAPQGIPQLADVGIIQVEEGQRDDLVRRLNLELDSVLVLEVAAFLDQVSDLLNQFRTIPLVLSGLAFLAAVVIVANAVALSTIERRKEIGLLKAVGTRTRWIIVQLVLENTILGLGGGLIGLLLAIAALVAITSLLELDFGFSIPIIVGVLALTALLASTVTLLSAGQAAAERPLEILRGE